MLSREGRTVTFKFADESQPKLFVSVAITSPVSVIEIPFQRKGNSVSHTTVSLKLVVAVFTVRFKVATESQLLTLDRDSVSVVVVFNTKPFQRNGSSFSQIAIFSVLLKSGRIVTLIVS